jgi:CheY-like chemotaxis protein
VSSKRILIVDDDRDVAQSFAGVLEASGYTTGIAANGREALDYLLKNNHPDLILLDLMMPVMDGWQFREEQRRVSSLESIPVVIVTADGNIRGKAASIQAAGYVAKPATIDELLNEVERICGVADT